MITPRRGALCLVLGAWCGAWCQVRTATQRPRHPARGTAPGTQHWAPGTKQCPLPNRTVRAGTPTLARLLNLRLFSSVGLATRLRKGRAWTGLSRPRFPGANAGVAWRLAGPPHASRRWRISGCHQSLVLQSHEIGFAPLASSAASLTRRSPPLGLSCRKSSRCWRAPSTPVSCESCSDPART